MLRLPLVCVQGFSKQSCVFLLPSDVRVLQGEIVGNQGVVDDQI